MRKKRGWKREKTHASPWGRIMERTVRRGVTIFTAHHREGEFCDFYSLTGAEAFIDMTEEKTMLRRHGRNI